MRVRVAASSANLGPGFDCVGLALDLCDELDLEIIDGPLEIEVEGQGAEEIPRDSSHLVVKSIATALQTWGHPMPGLRLRTRNSIPHSRGLGSSAAAIVAGLSLAWGIAFPHKQLDRAEILRLATLIEGHPDNAAAAVYGGGVLAWESDSTVQLVPLEINPELSFTVFIPSYHTPTAQARSVLPTEVPRCDAVVQAARAALLICALTHTPQHLLEATQDRLHQHYRADLMSPSYDVMMGLRDAGIPAVISGAGPTVLAITTKEQEIPCDYGQGFTRSSLLLGQGVQLS